MWYLPDAKLWHKAGGTAGGMLSVYYITRNTLYLKCRGRSESYRRFQAAKAAGREWAGRSCRGGQTAVQWPQRTHRSGFTTG